ncbi:hypothetical protein VTN96DRAFT_1938 [Rasamsonia emersonii]
MTVADLFFLHQRATANGVYLAVAALGAWLAPVAAGYCAVAQGWRWIWWWSAIILGISLVAMIFLYEETKYAVELALPGAAEPDIPSMSNKNGTTTTNSLMSAASREEQQQPRRMTKKSYWKRLALVTKTDEPFGRHVYRPFVILFTFPAVMYTALIYGLLLAWLSVISTVQSTYLPYPPYNFSAAGVGLFNLPPLIGAIVGSGLGGPLNGRWALWMAQRNRGVFEPEMRLWLSFPAIIACPAGILLFGLGLAENRPWIMLAVGSALFGLYLGAMGNISLTYLTDSYRDLVGDALVSVAFVRNGLATVIVFALTPWIESVGLYNMFVSAACLATAILLLTVPMIVWGKRARCWTAGRYAEVVYGQCGVRTESV